jgi:hypothetical protein
LFFFSQASAQESFQKTPALIFPVKPWPIKVQISFYLLSINRIDELAGTFDASIYVRLKWQEDRLRFTPKRGESSVRNFVGSLAVEREFKTIWSPELEFENATNQEFNNKTLFIHSDGSVEYLVGLDATFRSPLDFHLYPFDKQTFIVRVSSFIWPTQIMEFVLNSEPQHPLFDPKTEQFNDFYITDVKQEIVAPVILEEAARFSTLVVGFSLKRDPSYAIHQFVIPLILLFGLTCSAFFLEESNLGGRVWLITGTMLAFIATKYTIRSTLPKVGYMTILDLLFFISYVFGGIAVVISIIENIIDKYYTPLDHKADRIIWWALPLIFVIVCLTIIFFGVS